MPIPKPNSYERENDFISRCMSDEKMKNEYSDDRQRYSICKTSFTNTRLAGLKISFDYDGTLSTKKGTELAKKLIEDNNTIYIISARHDAKGMMSKAEELGIPIGRIYAMGTNKAKVDKIKQLGIDKHYDNNKDVVDVLNGKGIFLEETYNDYPQQAIENAKIALRYAEKNGWGDCGTAVGKQRANQLANKENISKDTISRMASFERHRQNSQKKLGDGCGRLMWLAWGGDAGIEWAQRKLKEID